MQSSKTAGHGNRVSGKGTGLIDGAQRSDAVHDVAFAAESSHGHSAADDLTEHRDIRIDVVQRLCAAEGNTETGHDFVNDEDGAVFGGFFSHGVEEFLSRRNHIHIAGNGFDNHAGDFIAFFVEELFELFGIVVFENNRVVGDGSGDTGRARSAERQQAGAAFDQQRVAVAVVAWFKE